MCPTCEANLANYGAVTIIGQQQRDGMIPAAGPCGAIALRGVAHPPPPSKWCGFRPLDGRVIVGVNGVKYQATPDLLSLLDVNDNGSTRALLVGASVAGAIVAVSTICLYNAFKALLARGFRTPTHTADPRTTEVLVSHIDLLLPGVTEYYLDMSFSEWIASVRPSRRKPLILAYELLEKFGWREAYRLFSSFVKSEKLVGFSKGEFGVEALESMIDRLINGPHDATHVIAGPLLKPALKAVKKVWNCDNHIFYAAVNPHQLDYWFNNRYRSGKVAILCDYRRYDNSHTDLTWDFIEELYRRLGLFDKHPLFAEVMRAWRAPEGTLRGKGWEIFFKAYVMNASGRDDTGLANALLNGFAMYISLVASLHRLPPNEVSSHHLSEAVDIFDLSVMGDDSLILVDESYLDQGFLSRLSDALAFFGLESELSIALDPFNMVYLGMRPYLVDGVWWWGKTIGRALFKWGWKLQPNNMDAPAWMTGVADHDVKTARHVPILFDLAEAYVASRVGSKRTPFTVDVCKPWTVGNPMAPDYTEETIVYVAQGYGVSIQELQDCIRYIQGVDTFPCIIDHPVLQAILMHDDY